jgi:isopropylmalate/isohomocitrate dehydrogenase-like protein
MGRKYRIALIEGDGVGPEIIKEALILLEALGFNGEFINIEAGKKYFQRTGKPIEDEAFIKLRNSDALLKGPVSTPLGPGTYRSVNVLLRKELGLYANVRPFKSFRGISLREIDLIVVRENTEGAYSGKEDRFEGGAISYRIITEEASRRISKFAFELAVRLRRSKVTVVHKANILKESDGLFRKVFFDVARGYSNVTYDEIIVDAAAYKLIINPKDFDVLVTPNLYGDILSDLAAGLVGSLGLCGSAQIGDNYAAFEPVHGTAEDIAGKGVVNPIGEFMAVAYMLDWLYSVRGDEKLRRLSNVIQESTRAVVEYDKILTKDLGGNARTHAVTKAIIKRASEILSNF